MIISFNTKQICSIQLKKLNLKLGRFSLFPVVAGAVLGKPFLFAFIILYRATLSQCSVTALTDKLPFGSVTGLCGAGATLLHCDHLRALRIQRVLANVNTNKVVNIPAQFLVGFDVFIIRSTRQSVK